MEESQKIENYIEQLKCSDNKYNLPLSNFAQNENKKNIIKIKKSSQKNMYKIFDVLPHDLEDSIAYRNMVDKRSHMFPASDSEYDISELRKKFNKLSDDEKKNYRKVHIIKLDDYIIVIDFDAHGDNLSP